MRCFFNVLFLFFPWYVMAAVQLQYLPSVSVQQTSHLNMEVQESQPILNMSTQGTQMFKFDLVSSNLASSQKGLKLPATLTLTIRDVSIHVKANKQEVAFDLRHPSNSPSLNEFAHLVNQPLRLAIDSHGQLESHTETFERLLKEHPALSQLPLDSLVKDLVFGLFALYEEDLSVGAKIEMESSNGPVFAIPAFVTYEISEISDQEVVALLTGKIGPRKITLDKTLQLNGNRSQKVEMTITGKLQGKASWQRNNAMIYGLNCEYQYDAALICGEKRWGMKMKVSQSIVSSQSSR